MYVKTGTSYETFGLFRLHALISVYLFPLTGLEKWHTDPFDSDKDKIG